jgi:5-oxoprolinase (ATP-hydrolysing) subunit A
MILNCDIGEEIMTIDVHAGSAATMERLVAGAIERRVAIGAHPSLDDRENFGRRPMATTPDDAYRLVLDQSLLLLAFVLAAGGVMTHVKPHGALYTMSSNDPRLADAIAHAVHDIDPLLVLVGLSGSESIAAGKRLGLRTASEVLADRGYLSDGSLAPRGTAGSLVTDPRSIATRAIRMMQEGTVMSVDGVDIPIVAETICVHGDGEHALAAARMIVGGVRSEKGGARKEE